LINTNRRDLIRGVVGIISNKEFVTDLKLGYKSHGFHDPFINTLINHLNNHIPKLFEEAWGLQKLK
jgi:hypothetical protein